MMPLYSEVSCSSVHGSFVMSYGGFDGSAGGVLIAMVSSSAAGVEGARTLPFVVFFRGGIVLCFVLCEVCAVHGQDLLGLER
jgi:hypothetical protein